MSDGPNITPAGTDFSTWERSNLERLAVELTAEVLRLRAVLDAIKAGHVLMKPAPQPWPRIKPPPFPEDDE